jgi:hypothetical protein
MKLKNSSTCRADFPLPVELTEGGGEIDGRMGTEGLTIVGGSGNSMICY